MFKRRTEVYSIPDFLNGGPCKRVEGGISEPVKAVITASVAAGVLLGTNAMVFADPNTAVSAVAPVDPLHPVSKVFDAKIWPLFLDIGEPLAKTMMAIGIYKCIRSDVDKGWKMVYRSGIGLVALYLIDGGIHILQSVGQSLQQA